MDSRDQLIKSQQSAIAIRDKEIKDLREKIILMKKLVDGISREWDIRVPPSLDLNLTPDRINSWSDKSKKFSYIRSQLLETVLKLAQRHTEPIHQSVIIKEARRMHKNLKHIDESTLTARLREMRNPMELLIGYPDLPQGHYYPSKKATELT